MEGSAHYDGRAIDVFFRPINEANQTRGWAVAQYLVGNAARLDIRTVIFDDRIWTAGRDGWRDYDPPEQLGIARPSSSTATTSTSTCSGSRKRNSRTSGN